MTEAELQRVAEGVLERVLKDGPPERRVVPVDNESEYYPDVKRRISDMTFSVLTKDPGLAFFFDAQGRVTGWRDNGRKGSAVEVPVERESLLQAVVAELSLPTDSRLGECEPRVLPPVGWTYQAVIITARVPTPEDVVRVWVDPVNMKVIQCLYGAKP